MSNSVIHASDPQRTRWYYWRLCHACGHTTWIAWYAPAVAAVATLHSSLKLVVVRTGCECCVPGREARPQRAQRAPGHAASTPPVPPRFSLPSVSPLLHQLFIRCDHAFAVRPLPRAQRCSGLRALAVAYCADCLPYSARETPKGSVLVFNAVARSCATRALLWRSCCLFISISLASCRRS
jgi:hypothetical protein